jgi:uncharacterized membrane protein YqaE (UPF0057 family)
MKLFLCFVFPPLAVVLAGKPMTSVLTFMLTLLGWIPGVIHALFVVNNAEAERRNEKLIAALNNRC